MEVQSQRLKQNIPRTGILLLPPISQFAKEKIVQLAKVSDIVINSPLRGVNTDYQIHYVSSDPAIATNIRNDDLGFDLPQHDYLVTSENTQFNLRDKNARQVAIMQTMLTKLNIQRLVIMTPHQIPALFVHLALKYLSPAHLRVICGSHLATREELRHAIITHKTQFKREYTSLLKPETQDEIKPEDCLLTPSGVRLRPYQQRMVNFAIKKKRVGLFVDMGLGKTLATLATMDQLVKNGQLDVTRPVLIVAPIMVALDTWSREAEKWGYDFDVLINIRKTPKKRKELFDQMRQPHDKLTLVTTNPQQLKPLLSYLNDNGCPDLFQMIVVDELSQFKSATTQRFKYLEKIAFPVEYFIGLTGTPTPNSLLDLYSEMIAIDPENRNHLGDNYYLYRSRFFTPDFVDPHTNQVYSWRPKADSEDKIFNILKRDVISLKSNGLVDLPKIVFDDRYVKLNHKASKTYHNLDKQVRIALSKLKDEHDDSKKVNLQIGDSSIDVANSAILTSKLLQLSSGAVYSDLLNFDGVDGQDLSDDQVLHVTPKQASASHDEHDYTVFSDDKLRMLQDIVDNATSPVLVFFYFRSELERMKEFFDFEYLDPNAKNVQDIISRWNQGKIPVLVAHPASAGHGLNLQEGGHIMVWLTLPWSNEQYRQSIKRLYRSGQTDTVSVIRILAAGTVDEDVAKRLDRKEEGQDRLMTNLDNEKR